MFAASFSSWLIARRIHYGWIVAASTFLTMLVMSASLSIPGAMLRPIGIEFGWSVEQISSAFALRFALYGVMGPFAAVLMERFGLRNVICAALAAVGTAMALVTVANKLWQLFMLWGLMLGIGTGMTALVLGAVVANRWFSNRRGLVMGVLTASSATGQLAFMPVAAWMIEHWGWRSAIIPLVSACVVLILLTVAFMRNGPGELGLRPFGEVGDPSTPTVGLNTSMTFKTPFSMLHEGAKNKTFRMLFVTFFVCGLSTNGLIQTHFITLCGDYGMGAVLAASALAMMGAFDFFGTIFSGFLSDRFDNRKLLFWYYGLRGLSLFWLPHSTFTLYGLSLFAMFYGLDWIATVPPTVRLVSAEFGREKAGFMFGWIFAGHQLGAATAAYGAGFIRTALLTYTPALYTAGGACLVAAVVCLLIRAPAFVNRAESKDRMVVQK